MSDASAAQNALIIGGGPLALLLALILHKQGVSVTIAGELSPTAAPLNTELMLIGGDDILPSLFQTSLQAWRTLPEELGLLPLLTETTAEDIATSPGRVTKLQEEAMFDALGGEAVSYIPTPPASMPLALGSKTWQRAPRLVPDTLSILQEEVRKRAIPRLLVNPVSLSIGMQPQLTMEDGSMLTARNVIFTSARALRRVLPPLGLPLPLRPARGHVVMMQTEKPHGLPLMLQRLQRGHLFFVPQDETRVDIHYDAINDPAQSTLGTGHSFNLVTALQQHINHLVPALRGATLLKIVTARHWLTPDFLPALGPWPGLPGVLVATGWGGRGTAYAAGAAALLAEAITSDPPPPPLPGLVPNRFANGFWEVVKQPASLKWTEPVTYEAPSMLSVKPDYAANVTLTEAPKPQYAAKVNQVEKAITESAARRPAAPVQVKSKTKKIQTAAIKKEE